jgi:hypothetical protein
MDTSAEFFRFCCGSGVKGAVGSSMAWVPPYPPTQGLSVAISNPVEGDDGVVRYRVMSHFAESSTAFDGPLISAPIPDAEVVNRIVNACNDVLVIRRFSEFDAVFKAFSGIKTTPPLPPIPEKKLFGNKDPKFVEDRRLAIENYIKAVFQHPSLYRRPDFLHLIGFSSLQLWFALSGPDDEAPTDGTLHAVFDVDSEILRSDVIQKANTARSDAVRRSTGRLLHYAMLSSSGVRAFAYENARLALTAVATKAEHDSTRYWIAQAVGDFASGSNATKQLVGRGDVRDALITVAEQSQSHKAMRACVRAIEMMVVHGSAGIKYLFVSEKVRLLLTSYVLKFTTPADITAVVSIIKALCELVPEIPRCPPGLFIASDVHGALGFARDVAVTSKDSALHDLVLATMALTQTDVGAVASTPRPAPETYSPWSLQSLTQSRGVSNPSLPSAPLPSNAQATAVPHSTNISTTIVSTKPSAADDFLEEDFDAEVVPTAPAATTASAVSTAKQHNAVDDFLDDDDDPPPAPSTASTSAAKQASLAGPTVPVAVTAASAKATSAVDDFLADDD